ncbi:hypothetical protein pEaSNUABM28_00251 [Erwinia phage pEa_SNUABM_28]|uniref:Uncharacterized protein n=1 Tax=Erwinia phage pEa_SNUABM_16 TaxID=2869544 RepID=A0AAE9BV34_9CAUD|nr:hypothetical protein MPK64_gp249 [Erwinia phage pEa_SNUABM_16]QZE58808.1 hypothetical protein pEaSNUABM28_00251 [Erwinia phage pEa_SNUABM_28]QZE59152.1 hypothetical protein pEaSNUABM18_00249 [Erwinia phage pEa_SNUABM_18]UAW96393.1 hypothetical protein pEaSNUABM16_00249 [Erwinia phage pEa_SNUABM_16]
MKKIQHVTLPTDALNGLIHGYYHHSKTTDEFCRSLIYIDVTDRSASDALYAILKREPTKGIVPMGYDCLREARGHTAPAQLAIVLSNNLLHIDNTKMAGGVQAIFNALARTTHTNDTQITVYGEPGVSKILNIMRDIQYKEYINAPESDIVLGDFNLESNMTIDHFVHMAIDPKFEEAIRNSPATEFKLGSSFMFMHPDELTKVVRMVRRCSKICIMHPDIHRYYFENVICKY